MLYSNLNKIKILDGEDRMTLNLQDKFLAIPYFIYALLFVVSFHFILWLALHN